VIAELIDLIGDFTVTFDTISGTVTETQAVHDGETQTSTSQSGSFVFSRDNKSAKTATVSVESTTGAVILVSVSCPVPEEVTIIKATVNSADYAGQTIHNENGIDTGASFLSDLIQLLDGSGLILSDFRTIVGPKGSSIFPLDSEEVRIRSNKKQGDSFNFIPGTHKLRYFESNTLYGPSDIEFIIASSSVVATVQNGNINFADYEYGGSDYIYLIYDYRFPKGIDLCYSAIQPLDACCSCVVTTTTTTTTTTLPYSSFALYLRTDIGTGWDGSTEACAGTGSIFFLFGAPGYSSLSEFFNDGKRLFSNTSLTNQYNGQDKWFKTAQLPGQGRTIQIGPDGFINTIGSDC
jgi:hypothetical protein